MRKDTGPEPLIVPSSGAHISSQHNTEIRARKHKIVLEMSYEVLLISASGIAPIGWAFQGGLCAYASIPKQGTLQGIQGVAARQPVTSKRKSRGKSRPWSSRWKPDHHLCMFMLIMCIFLSS